MAKNLVGPSEEECVLMSRTCAFHALRRATRVVTQLFDAYFDEIGLKATQYTVLVALSHGGEEPTVTELAESLVLEQSSLSRNLAVLERLGLIRMGIDGDRRKRRPMLTRAGRAAVVRGYPQWKKVQTAVGDALGTDDLSGQLASLRRLTRTAKGLRSVAP